MYDKPNSATTNNKEIILNLFLLASEISLLGLLTGANKIKMQSEIMNMIPKLIKLFSRK